MPNVPSLQDLMKAGVHFGHQKSKWHPKMKPFIFTDKNGIHIINLEETQKYLATALEFVKNTVASGATVLFLGTKKQSRGIVKDAALSCGMPYVVNRWLGGTLTNSKSVLGVVKKYRKLKEEKATGAWEKYTKKERLKIDRQIEKLETLVGGIENVDKIPEAVFAIDVKYEKTAIKEAMIKKLKIVAITDTNVNPQKVDYPIPANDDATSSINLLVGLVAEAVKEGKLAAQSNPETKPAPKK